MDVLARIESKLNELLVTKAPFQLPANWRKWLATHAWVFSMLGVIFGAIAGLLLLTGVLFATAVSTVVVDPYTGVAGTTSVHHFLLLAWLALIILLGEVLLQAVATPKLKRMEKSGWNLLFYSSLFFVGYDIFNWLQYPAAVGSLIGNLVGALIGLYFLFQVRSYFVGQHAAAKVPSPVQKA